MNVLLADNELLERMVRAVENVRRRMERAARALSEAGVPYAVAGGNAVAAWVATVDVAAIRNTQDVDVILRRADLPRAKAAMEQSGFVFRHVKSIDMFLDGPEAKARDAVHLLFAGEKVRSEDLQEVPDVNQVFIKDRVAFAPLEALVRMKLTSFRDKDRTHLRDLIGVDLIDASWHQRLPAELATRLQQLLDTPDG
jgi:hypothetical protein